MSLNTDPRFRINASQTAKNLWQFNATVEYKSEKIEMPSDEADQGKTVTTTLGLRLLSLIKETEKEFRADGRLLVSDLK